MRAHSSAWFYFALFLTGLVHRCLQFYLLWPNLSFQIELNAQAQVMQLLPIDVFKDHWWQALWYLQQAPPLPNFLYALLANAFDDATSRAAVLLGLQGIMSSISAVLLAALLIKLHIHRVVAFCVALIFILSADLLLVEYHTWGHFFYEITAMLLCLLICLSALTARQKSSLHAAALLGLWTALLALTRASFSYISPLILIWLMANKKTRKPLLIASFLIPVLLLHGGWVAKNYAIHGYWAWPTSTWGGANAHTGNIHRGGLKHFRQWENQQAEICEQPWDDMLQGVGGLLIVFPDFYNAEKLGVPPEIDQHDKMIANQRGKWIKLDTLSTREMSHCLQQAYIRDWLENPKHTIHGALQSYRLFWAPIHQFAVTQPNSLKPDVQRIATKAELREILDASWQQMTNIRYKLLQVQLSFNPIKKEDWATVTVLVLPFLPGFIHWLNMIAIHLLPALLAYGLYRRLSHKNVTPWPEGFGLLLIFYIYLAALSSLVEYGENMRFRIAIEPLIWAITTLILYRYWQWGKERMRSRRDQAMP